MCMHNSNLRVGTKWIVYFDSYWNNKSILIASYLFRTRKIKQIRRKMWTFFFPLVFLISMHSLFAFVCHEIHEYISMDLIIFKVEIIFTQKRERKLQIDLLLRLWISHARCETSTDQCQSHSSNDNNNRTIYAINILQCYVNEKENNCRDRPAEK